MIQIYGNYHGDITLQRLCPHCEEEDDTTEHLLSCKVFQSSLKYDHLKNECNGELWRQILEMVTFNLKHRGGNIQRDVKTTVENDKLLS